MKKSKMHRAAMAYALYGWRVFPIYHVGDDGLCSCWKQRKYGDCSDAGKHPVSDKFIDLQNGFESATTDTALIDKWWRKYPQANIGTPDFLRLDIDTGDGHHYDGAAAWEELMVKHGDDTPVAPTCYTGSGGQHVYFLAGNDYGHTNSAGKLPKGIDVRGDGGGYTILPPSNHTSGNCYTWHKIKHPSKIEVPPAPQWLIDLLPKDDEVANSVVSFKSANVPDMEGVNVSPLVQAVISGDRSRIDHCVVTALVGAGCSDDQILAIYKSAAVGEKFREKGVHGEKYLSASIIKARNYIEANRASYVPVIDEV